MPGPIPRFEDVDPRTLHLPPNMAAGADPIKFTRQLSLHGLSTAGMHPPVVQDDPDGRLMLYDGVTRATRVAKFLPGQLLRVEVSQRRSKSFAWLPTVGDRLP